MRTGIYRGRQVEILEGPRVLKNRPLEIMGIPYKSEVTMTRIRFKAGMRLQNTHTVWVKSTRVQEQADEHIHN